ncbi:MAG: PD-(D/E)XK nuclease family transposase, partial [Bacteroidales bacterium]|nr:PD-(D/E)XK nuclease family transposase [Bacteroidales bacterium]
METTEKETKKKDPVRGYANLLCDFMFKRVFGSEANKDMLIEFLNMVLEDIRIEHVDFTPNEHQGLTE